MIEASLPRRPVAPDLFCGVGEESLEPPRTAGIEASTPWRPVALDLFCGAGGASLGLRAAGEESCKRLKRYFS